MRIHSDYLPRELPIRVWMPLVEDEEEEEEQRASFLGILPFILFAIGLCTANSQLATFTMCPMIVRNQPELPAARRVLYESFRFLAGGLASLFTDIVFNFIEERETLARIRSIRRRLRWIRTTWREGDVGQRPPRHHNHGKNTDALNSLSQIERYLTHSNLSEKFYDALGCH